MSHGRATEDGLGRPGQTLKRAPSVERPRQHGAPVNSEVCAARSGVAGRQSSKDISAQSYENDSQ